MPKPVRQLTGLAKAIRKVFDTPKKRIGHGRYKLGEYVIRRTARPSTRSRNSKVIDGWVIEDSTGKVVGKRDRLWEAEQSVKGRMIKALKQEHKQVRKILFLDMDGVLTTAASRDKGGPDCFSDFAVAAMRRLLRVGKPDTIVIHSSWRKLPEPPPPYDDPENWRFPSPDGWWYWDLDWFRALCDSQQLYELAQHPDIQVAKYKFSSSRGHEIAWWIDDNGKDTDRHIIIDDEPYTIREAMGRNNRDGLNVMLIETSDVTGLQEDQVDEALEWW